MSSGQVLGAVRVAGAHRRTALREDDRVRFGAALVEGRSMLPTLRPGDRVLVAHGRVPAPGRVAVVRVPGDGRLAVKRVLRRDGDGLWVERDNPAEGADSWSWGRAVPDHDVVGTVLLRLWPRPGRLRPAPR